MCNGELALFVVCGSGGQGTRDVLAECRTRRLKHFVLFRLFVWVSFQEMMKLRDALLVHRARCLTRDMSDYLEQLSVRVRFLHGRRNKPIDGRYTSTSVVTRRRPSYFSRCSIRSRLWWGCGSTRAWSRDLGGERGFVKTWGRIRSGRTRP